MNFSRPSVHRYKFLLVAFAAFTFHAPAAEAWGRRGHALVCETAALLIEDKAILRSRAFDLEYFCNVPDLVWKKPATYKAEWFNHFMDLEYFDRAFRSSQIQDPFNLTRAQFNHAFPEVKNEAGRAFWRIRELDARLNEIANRLNKVKGDNKLSADAGRDAQHAAQLDWLITAGAIGHYVGDLSQPLHVTENYDGQLTGQRGIHAYFEDVIVDRLFDGIVDSPRALATQVALEAQIQWKKGKQISKNSAATPLALIAKLSEESAHDVNELLKIDRKNGRADDKKLATLYKKIIIHRLADGAVVTAQIWGMHLDWPYDGDKFFDFSGEPAYIPAAAD